MGGIMGLGGLWPAFEPEMRYGEPETNRSSFILSKTSHTIKAIPLSNTPIHLDNLTYKRVHLDDKPYIIVLQLSHTMSEISDFLFPGIIFSWKLMLYPAIFLNS